MAKADVGITQTAIPCDCGCGVVVVMDIAPYGPDPDDPIASRLYDRQREVAGFRAALEDARRERDQAVRRAVRADYPRAKISRATGLSNGMISRIAKGG